MRIVAGTHKGRAIAGPKSNAIRPTTDRVREAVFNILSHSIDGFGFAGIRVLDLFSGTGALGLEAMSRGARFAQFVDVNAQARGLVRTNCEKLGETGRVKIWRRDATRLGVCDAAAKFDLVFADPPYGQGLGDKALVELCAGGWLADGAIVVLEEAKSAQIGVPASLQELTVREHGDTKTMFLQAK